MLTGVTIVPRPGLTETERAQVERLRVVCNDADGLDLKLAFETAGAGESEAMTCALALDADEVVGYVSLDSGSSVEIAGMVHPSHRRGGIGRALLAATLREVHRRGDPKVLLIAEEGPTAAPSFVRAIGWNLDSREHRMELELTGWTPRGPVELALNRLDQSGAEVYATVAAEAFGEEPGRILEQARRSLLDPDERSYVALRRSRPGNPGEPVGVGRLVKIGRRAGVYGFAVLPAWRGRGVGGQMLDAMLVEARSLGYQQALLEVEPGNEAAVRLYRSRGFLVARTYGYYAPP